MLSLVQPPSLKIAQPCIEMNSSDCDEPDSIASLDPNSLLALKALTYRPPLKSREAEARRAGAVQIPNNSHEWYKCNRTKVLIHLHCVRADKRPKTPGRPCSGGPRASSRRGGGAW